MKESGTQAEQTVRQIPDSLTAVLYQPLVNGNIVVNAKITEQFRSTPEGTWDQGGGLEIPCFFEVFFFKSGLMDLSNSLKDELLKPNAGGTSDRKTVIHEQY